MKLFSLNNRDHKLIVLLFFTGIITRFPLIEKMQSHWDGSLFSMAVVNYTIEKNTPPLPGSPLYIAFGKFFNYFVNDPHIAILLVSVLFSGLSAAAFYIAGKAIYNSKTGIISSLIFLSCSTFYYFGITPYSFVILPFFWVLIGAAIYLLIFKNKPMGIFIGLMYAFGLGVRPQEGLFLTPMVLYSFLLMNNKEKKNFSISFILTFLAWFIPLMFVEGGFSYPKMILSHIPNYPIGFHQQDYELIVKGFFLTLGFSGFFLLHYIRYLRGKISDNLRKKTIFFSLWILPNFLFNAILVSVHAGYQMGYLIALVLLCANAIHKTFNRNIVLLKLVVLFIVVTNLIVFFWDRDPKFQKNYRPSSFHYTDIRKNDIKLGGKVDYIRKNYNPITTLIITTSTLWSPYMYHLKEYRQYSLEAIFTTNPRFIDERRDSYNWEVREYNLKNKFFKVPPNIKTLMGKKYRLPGNSFIVEIPVLGGERISYGFHKIGKF